MEKLEIEMDDLSTRLDIQGFVTIDPKNKRLQLELCISHQAASIPYVNAVVVFDMTKDDRFVTQFGSRVINMQYVPNIVCNCGNNNGPKKIVPKGVKNECTCTGAGYIMITAKGMNSRKGNKYAHYQDEMNLIFDIPVAADGEVGEIRHFYNARSAYFISELESVKVRLDTVNDGTVTHKFEPVEEGEAEGMTQFSFYSRIYCAGSNLTLDNDTENLRFIEYLHCFSHLQDKESKSVGEVGKVITYCKLFKRNTTDDRFDEENYAYKIMTFDNSDSGGAVD